MNIIDFHSHILPFADHGCKNPDVMKQQLKLAKDNNISTIIATSHFYPDQDTMNDFLIRRQRGLDYVIPEAKQLGITIIPAAETHWCRHIEKMEGIEKLSIQNKYLLLELPFRDFDTEEIKETAGALHQKGIDTILAHVERYPTDKILALDENYIHYQINAYSFFKFKVIAKTKKYLKTGKVVALGSDIHGTTDTYKYFSKMATRKKKVFEAILKESNFLDIRDRT